LAGVSHPRDAHCAFGALGIEVALIDLALGFGPVWTAPIAGAESGLEADILLEIRPQFERTTGHELVFQFAGAPELIRQYKRSMRTETKQ
jgi:hypothetical protein